MLDITGFRVLLFIIGCGLIGAAWWSHRRAAARRSKPEAAEPICMRCSYHLRGVPNPCCPECGADLSHRGVIARGERGSTFRLVRLWLLAGTGASIVLLCVLASVRIGAVRGEVTHVQVFAGSPGSRTLLQQPGPLRRMHVVSVRRPVAAADRPGEETLPQRPTSSISGPKPALPLPQWSPPRSESEAEADVSVSITPPIASVELSAPLREEDRAALVETLRAVFAFASAPRGDAVQEALTAADGLPLMYTSETDIRVALAPLPPDAIEWSRQEIDEAIEAIDASLSRTLAPHFQRSPSAQSWEHSSGWWSSATIYLIAGRAGTPLHRPWMAWALLGIVCAGSAIIVLVRRLTARGGSAHDFGLLPGRAEPTRGT